MCIEEKDKLTFSDMKFKRKICFIYHNITVEPMLACYIIPSVLIIMTAQNLNLEKACRVNLKYSSEVCDALTARQTGNYSIEEVQVQQLVAGMSVWRPFVQSLIPGSLIIFLGSWSDRRLRRKPFMLLPLVGEILACVSLIICTFFFYQLPMEVSGFLESFFPALTGGWMAMNMAVFSYLGDITSVENRTLRIGIVNVFVTAGIPIGIGLSGLLFKSIGFYGMFCTSAALYVIGFVCGYLNVKDVKRLPDNLKSNLDPDNKSNFENLQKVKHCDSTYANDWQVLGFLKDLFNFTHVRETIAVVFKDTNRQKRMVLLIVVLIAIMGPTHGEMTVIYLFMRYRFNWDEVQFSVFSTYSVIIHLIGTSFSVGVFSHLLKIDDALIGVMSCMSKILAGFVYAFARTEWQVYLGPLVDIINGTSFIAMRSIATKLVPPEELGKLNSMYGACEALTPLLYGPMYAFVYAHTMDTMPGAFFILGGALTLPAVVIFGWMYTQHRGDRLRTHNSRKPSVAEDVLKSLRADPLAISPAILDPSADLQQETEWNRGQINYDFQEENIAKP